MEPVNMRPGVTADVDHYILAADGGLIYDPLTREGQKTDDFGKYADTPLHTGTLTLGSATATFAVPKRMTAYDAVPLRYTLQSDDPAETLHLSVTAFEEPERRSSPSFDLNLPGTVDVTFTYLGYVAGQIKEGVHPNLQPDLNDVPGSEFPGFALSPLCYSGCLPVADRLWFRFAVRNTGDTILDADGNGSFMLEPVLFRKNDEGEYVRHAVPSNLFYRLFAPLYPGEETALYVACGSYPGYPAKPGPLEPGAYRLELAAVTRNESKQPEFMRNVWSGTHASVSTFDFTITEAGASEPPAPVQKQPPTPIDRNGWLHHYEEFLSSFVTSTRRPDGGETGTLAVQPAPWTQILVLRLMRGDEAAVAEICLPVEVESDSLALTLCPDHQGYVRLADGTRRPAVTTQSMTDMRGGSAISPYAGDNIINELLDMQQAGVNLITTTVAFAMETGLSPREKRGGARDAFKFTSDVLRELGLPMEGLISYPFASGATAGLASAIKGQPVRATRGIADPAVTEAGELVARYEFLRYGDNYWQMGDGRVPLCIEDTRGWIRYDQHNRYPEGEASLERFREWLKARYGTIEALNAAWGSELPDFDAVDPEADGGPGAFGHKNEFRTPGRVFCDYNAAMWDWDVFRAALRREQYRQILDFMKPLCDTAGISLRTEGANWLVAGIPFDHPNPKYRHVRHSQLHCGIQAEELMRDPVVAVHSDYTTLPYTPSEVAELTRMSVEQGILPLHMPQFNRMRDIAINPRWGSDDYNVSYGLKTPMKGAYVNTLTAVFPWFKATYENGGVPGILWQDYTCDGFVTQTQFREMCFYKEKLDALMATPAGQAWAAEPGPEDGFRERATPRWSFPPAYIKAECDRVKTVARTAKYDHCGTTPEPTPGCEDTISGSSAPDKKSGA